LQSGQFQTSTFIINGVVPSVPGGSGHVHLFFLLLLYIVVLIGLIICYMLIHVK
jgi:hypothetical protein